jgi:hypothetical protein
MDLGILADMAEKKDLIKRLSHNSSCIDCLEKLLAYAVNYNAISDASDLVRCDLLKDRLWNVQTKSLQYGAVVVNILLKCSRIIIVKVGVDDVILLRHNCAKNKIQRPIVAQSDSHTVTLDILRFNNVLGHGHSSYPACG